MTCEARQYSDQKRCERCDLTWDMNDFDPPKCLTAEEIGHRTLSNLNREFAHFPDRQPQKKPGN